MSALFRRELKGYFYTPTGYLFLIIALSLSGLLFYLNNLIPRTSELTPLLSMLSYVWMLLSPVLVVRLLAGERQQMTDQLLITSPLSSAGIVLAKFLAAALVMLMYVALTFVYPLIVAAYARVWLGELFTVYLGFILQGLAFVALDMMVTGFMKRSASAVAAALGVNLFVWLAGLLSTAPFVPSGISRMVSFLSLYERFLPFLSGQLSFASALYFLLFTATMLVIAICAMEIRRVKTA
ncbi:MAG: ABC transporter permease [Christensenellales bacterium]|jgi:ABC-2 type transport system permease protein